jgi:cyclic pyranopterin phosphate synthase
VERLNDLTDTRGRGLRDLRISVTDRCNFRCPYCMPREVFGPGFAFLERQELLSFEEIVRVVEAGAELGVSKIRLTGGEPLLRRDLDGLIAMLAAVEGIEDIALTTNGSLLSAHAGRLRQAGLDRVTVSLDSLDDEVFQRMSDTRLPLRRVLDGIAAAQEAGFTTVKVNTVVRRGVNDAEIVDLAGWARDQGVTVRFIEFMDVGSTNGWRRDEVVESAEVVRRITQRWAATPVPAGDPQAESASLAGGRSTAVAERWRYDDGHGEFGVISSVSSPFCSTCVRARLSAVGELFTCLFAAKGTDLRAVLRSGADHDELRGVLAGLWGRRDDRYSELRAGLDPNRGDGPDKVEMSYIGG